MMFAPVLAKAVCFEAVSKKAKLAFPVCRRPGVRSRPVDEADNGPERVPSQVCGPMAHWQGSALRLLGL